METQIKVVVKVRPVVVQHQMQLQLTADRNDCMWNVEGNQIFAADSKDCYAFDTVFDENSTTLNLYDEVARPIVEATLDGINGTIFAYGQTSSGKTYTMMGEKDSPGIIPLAINNIFELVKSKSDRDFLIRVSFIEIYNEKIKDLLDFANPNEVKIREDFYGNISVTCKELIATNPEKVLEIMQEGNQNRSIGETAMNEKSSRSHSIFQIIIESRKHASPGGEYEDSVNVSQLNLVDLAGSERVSQTVNAKRFREGCHINRSLTTLGLVIRQLSTPGDLGFVNYRDSKLTRILQSSLGGNAKTGIICTITPTSLDETHSTLKFAMCAKTIKNKPTVNTVVSDATQLKIVTRQLATLQKQLETKKNLEEDNQRLYQKISELKAQIVMGKETVQRSTRRRCTWWGQNLLLPIAENDSQTSYRNDGSLLNLNLKKDTFQFQDTPKNNDSIFSDRASTTSTASCVSVTIPNDIICLDSSEDCNDMLSSNMCSPEHKCHDILKTPPCILKGRFQKAQKDLRELEEMTSLERQFGHDVANTVKQLNELKKDHEITLEDLENLRISEKQLNSELSNKNKEIEIFKTQMEKKMTDLQYDNEGLSYQLEANKVNHKKREEELLFCLDEARKHSKGGDVNQSDQSFSQIPIALHNNKKKVEPDENQLIELVQKHPSFLQKISELKEQIQINEKLNLKIEELNYKLNISNEKISEVTNENAKLLNRINELEITINGNNQIIEEQKSNIFDLEVKVNAVQLPIQISPIETNQIPAESICDSCMSKNDVENEAMDKLKVIVNDFEQNLSKLVNQFDLQISSPHAEDLTIENIYMIHHKIDNIKYFHELYSSEVEKQKLALNENNEKLAKDNESLKLEINNAIKNIKEIAVESETLYKMVVGCRNEQQVASAEFSLVTSQLNASNHFHHSLHTSCNSLVAYLRPQLLRLQSFLQNVHVNDEDITDLANQSYNSLFSTQVADISSICCVKKENDSPIVKENDSHIVKENDSYVKENHLHVNENDLHIKENDSQIVKEEDSEYMKQFSELNSNLETKISENAVLSENIRKLEERIRVLESENCQLSDELMDCLQDAENLNKSNNNINRNSISTNTSILMNRRSSISPMKNADSTLIHNFEDSLRNIFEALKIEYKVNKDYGCIAKITALNIAIENSTFAIEKLLQEEILKDNEVKRLNDEICTLNQTVEEKTLTETKLSDDLKNMSQLNDKFETEITSQKSENINLNEQVQEIVRKCDILAKTEIELRQIIEDKQSEIEQLKTYNNEIKMEMTNLTLNLNNKNEEIAELNSKVESLIKDIIQKNNETEILKNRINDLNGEVLKLESSSTTDNVSMFSQILENYVTNVCSILQINHKIPEDVDDEKKVILIRDNTEKSISAIEKLIEHQALHENELQKIDSDLQSLNTKIEEKNLHINEINDDLNNALQMNNELKTENANIVSKLDDTMLERGYHKEMEAKLQNENTNKEIEIEQHKNRIEQLNVEVTEAKKNINLMNEQIEQLNNKILQQNNNEKVLIEEKLVLNSELSSLNELITKNESNEKNQITILQDKIKLYETDITSKSNEIQLLKEEIESKSTEQCNVKDELEKYQLEINSKAIEIEALRSELVFLNGEFTDKLEQQLGSHEKNVKELLAKLQTCENNNGELKQQISNNQIEMNNVQQSNHQLKMIMKQQTNNFEEEMKRLRADCECYVSQIKSKESNEAKLMTELGNLTGHANSLEASLKRYECENNEINAKLVTLESKYKETAQEKQNLIEFKSMSEKLQFELNNLRKDTTIKDKTLNQFQAEFKSLNGQMQYKNDKEQELINNITKLEAEKLNLEKKLEKAQTETPVSKIDKELMDLLVDKMTYEIELEKNKQFEKANNELRNKNKELTTEIRRLKHSLQNFSLNGLDSNDRTNTELRENNKNLQLKLAEKDATYKELSDEYDDFLKIHKDLEKQSNELYTENSNLRARVANCEIELSECKENSQQQERKKRRQSLHDKNRGCYSPLNNSAESNRRISIMKENQEVHQSPCHRCAENEFLKTEYNRLKAHSVDLEAKLAARSTGSSAGSGIVMNQKLCEFMAENHQLREKNTKLKQLCQMRAKKIQELEEFKKNN